MRWGGGVDVVRSSGMVSVSVSVSLLVSSHSEGVSSVCSTSTVGNGLGRESSMIMAMDCGASMSADLCLAWRSGCGSLIF